MKAGAGPGTQGPATVADTSAQAEKNKGKGGAPPRVKVKNGGSEVDEKDDFSVDLTQPKGENSPVAHQGDGGKHKKAGPDDLDEATPESPPSGSPAPAATVEVKNGKNGVRHWAREQFSRKQKHVDPEEEEEKKNDEIADATGQQLIDELVVTVQKLTAHAGNLSQEAQQKLAHSFTVLMASAAGGQRLDRQLVGYMGAGEAADEH
jgi:hypothetical protein